MLEHGSDIDQNITIAYKGPYNGDGVDPSQPTELPQRTPVDWIAYAVSLNYNRVCVSGQHGFHATWKLEVYIVIEVKANLLFTSNRHWTFSACHFFCFLTHHSLALV